MSMPREKKKSPAAAAHMVSGGEEGVAAMVARAWLVKAWVRWWRGRGEGRREGRHGGEEDVATVVA